MILSMTGSYTGFAMLTNVQLYCCCVQVAVIEAKDLGGTCVNVGCVPKKIMWNAATVHEMMHEAKHFGSTTEGLKFDWAPLVTAREDYITKLNGIYAKNLENSGVETIHGVSATC
jgi:glutathione reductase (NADPH)